MSDTATTSRPPRREFRNINAFKDLPGYRWPLAAMVSGMHRASGLFLFLMLPFILWLFDTSVSSEISFTRFSSLFGNGAGPMPGWFYKLVALALIWAYLHHFVAGLRHIHMDIAHDAVSKQAGRVSAIVTLAISLTLTVTLGAKLFGLY